MSSVDRFHYSQCGLRIRSEVELALPVQSEGSWDVDVCWGNDPEAPGPPAGEAPIASLGNGTNTWYVVERYGDGYRAWFRGCGDFIIDAECSRVVIYAHEDRPDLIPIVMAGTVSAILLNLRGATLLHASAVSTEEQVLAFVGQSGRGKSTVAALMCVAGAKLVADDLLRVAGGDPPTCIGGSNELRLRQKAFGIPQGVAEANLRRTADQRLAFDPGAAGCHRMPLVGVVIPSPSRDQRSLSFDLLKPADALMTLLAFPRVHGWTDPGVLSRDFATLGQLVNEVPVWNAVIPWGPPFSPTIATEIAGLVGGETMAPVQKP